MERSPHIRRVSHAARPARTRRRRETSGAPVLRVLVAADASHRRPLARPSPVGPPHRPTLPGSRLRLVASSPEPRLPRREKTRPQLRLVRSRQPLAALSPSPPIAFRRRRAQAEPRAGQLITATALAIAGLLALVASVGQILAAMM